MTKRSKKVRLAVARLDEIIEEYKKEHPAQERDWRTYEQQFARRAKIAFHNLEPLVEEAVSTIKIETGENRGNDPKLTLKQKVLVLLLKHFCGKSNRMMEWMVVMFSLLTSIDVSYKTIERLYSDEAVRLAIFNLHSLLLKKKGIKEADCGGDGTGHALLVSQHYATSAQKLKDKAKEVSGTVKFVYSFALIDIKERMYIGYGTSFKSEKEAFERALSLAKRFRIKVNSLRLDRYYSGESYVNICQEALGNVKMYMIPKKNIDSLGVGEWCKMIYAFVEDTKAFLREYVQRNQS
ncbi:ISNCY family transposase [Candidatus Woesearchaeota archaeon]|nr:ISNCY family transposase [Candidatus Woesearchaeota archaeon]